MTEFRIFFSWQSDLPSNQTKRFIEDCIEMAKNKLAETISIVPDEATRNRLGSPDIMESIFDKIEECDLFIADVSIVGSYLPEKAESDEEPKCFPNPNVLLELGYASSCISWDRCICLANTKYGDISKLPFDLNHRRITPFSFSQGTRVAEVNRIADIIVDTVKAYSGIPLPKKDFAHHVIGGYDFTLRQIQSKLMPFNTINYERYFAHSQKLKEEIRELVSRISAINLPPSSNDTGFSDIIPPNMSIQEALNNPAMSQKLSGKLFDKHNVTVEKETIDQYLLNLCGTEVNEEFYYVGNLMETPSFSPITSSTLDGTETEVEKYDLICELEKKLLDLDFREKYIHTFDDMLILPLAIQNVSTKSDKHITIDIQVVQGVIIQPMATLISEDLVGFEGDAYDLKLASELLYLPEDTFIKYEEHSNEVNVPSSMMANINIPFMNESNEEDYETELQEYIQASIPGSEQVYTFSVCALRPKEMIWLVLCKT